MTWSSIGILKNVKCSSYLVVSLHFVYYYFLAPWFILSFIHLYTDTHTHITWPTLFFAHLTFSFPPSQWQKKKTSILLPITPQIWSCWMWFSLNYVHFAVWWLIRMATVKAFANCFFKPQHTRFVSLSSKKNHSLELIHSYDHPEHAIWGSSIIFCIPFF